MLMNVYRLVPEEQALESLVSMEHACIHDAHELPAVGVAVAWESPELAAMVSEEFLWHQGRRTTFLREVVTLPRAEGLHKVIPAGGHCVFEDLARLPLHLLSSLTAQGLLSLWLPSARAPQQHVVLLNLQHAAFSRVQVMSRQLTLTRPLLRTRFEPQEAVRVDVREPQAAARRPEFQFGPPLLAAA